MQVGGEGVRIQRGNCVLEVRNGGGSKGVVARAARESAGDGALLLAIGDDATDEELFEATRPHGVAVRVGGGETCADARLEDVAAVRQALAGILA
jgi:trehalose 6-phosphate synthase/phosphatase